MALVITKKVRTILLIVLAILLVGGGGFLIWTVTTKESVAPEDSEAAPAGNIGPKSSLTCDGILIDLGHTTHLRYPKTHRYGRWVCGTNCMSKELEYKGACSEEGCSDEEVCPSTRSFSIDSELPEDFVEGIYSIVGLVGRGHYIPQGQTNEDFKITINQLSNDNSLPATASNAIDRKDPLYKEGGAGDYWEGKNSLGEFHLLEDSNSSVSMNHINPCNSVGDPSPGSVHVYQFCLTQENICEGGDWEKEPTSEVAYGTSLNPITIETTDADGLGDIRAITVNETPVPTCGPTEGVTCYKKEGDDIELLLDPGMQHITSGPYQIHVAWEDGLGIGGSNCVLDTNFTVLEEEIDPACGTLATDSLASSYPANTEDWPEGTFCAVGDPEPEEPVFPAMGGSTSWTCSGTSDPVKCTATRADETPVVPPEEPEPEPETPQPPIPQTGIFDTVLGRVSVGVSFIFLGGLVSQYSKFNYLLNSISEKQQFRNEIKKQKKSNRRRNKLEERFQRD